MPPLPLHAGVCPVFAGAFNVPADGVVAALGVGGGLVGRDAVEDSVLYMESLLKAQIERSGSFVAKLDKWQPQYCGEYDTLDSCLTCASPRQP